jgi:3-deoxy-D-manno-octulosonic-acid transferase
MIYFLYHLLSWLTYPFVKIWIYYRCLIGKEDKSRFQERFGLTHKARPEGTLLWFHGASIGESLSFLPVLEAFRKKYPDLQFLATTGTKGAAELMARRLPEGCLHQYVPLDHPLFVKRFLKYWAPSAAFFTESDLWPNLLMEAQRGRPVFLLNGRLSENSFKRWKWAGGFFKELLGSFALIFPQTEMDEYRFKYFTKSNVKFLGNLKFVGDKLPVEAHDLKKLQKEIHGRVLWIASNTHDKEEEVILEVHGRLQKKFKDLLLILVPRHANRLPEIISVLERLNLSFVKRSTRQPLTAKDSVYVVDSLGEMGIFYSVGSIVFMGGSLFPNVGGHNILEPARFEDIALFGPYMENNQDMADFMLKNKAALQVKGGEDLEIQVKSLLESSKKCKEFSERVKKTLGGTHILEPIFKEIQKRLTFLP